MFATFGSPSSPTTGSFQSSQPDLDLGRFLWRHRGLWPCLYARRCCIQHECMGEGAAWSQWQCPVWAMGLGIGILVERNLSTRVCCCLLIRPRKLEIASCSNNVFFVILSLPSSIIQRPEVILSLLTAFGGASVGPEPVVIIMPSVLYVALVKRVLNPSVHVLRIAALAGGAGGLAAFFGLPLASAFLASTRRENRLKGWGRELNENWEASLGFWSSWFLFKHAFKTRKRWKKNQGGNNFNPNLPGFLPLKSRTWMEQSLPWKPIQLVWWQEWWEQSWAIAFGIPGSFWDTCQMENDAFLYTPPKI